MCKQQTFDSGVASITPLATVGTSSTIVDSRLGVPDALADAADGGADISTDALADAVDGSADVSTDALADAADEGADGLADAADGGSDVATFGRPDGAEGWRCPRRRGGSL